MICEREIKKLRNLKYINFNIKISFSNWVIHKILSCFSIEHLLGKHADASTKITYKLI